MMKVAVCKYKDELILDIYIDFNEKKIYILDNSDDIEKKLLELFKNPKIYFLNRENNKITICNYQYRKEIHNNQQYMVILFQYLYYGKFFIEDEIKNINNVKIYFGDNVDRKSVV